MYKSLRKMKAADRRKYLMDEVSDVLSRAKKASRFLSDEQKNRLKEAETFLKKAAANAESFGVSGSSNKESISETFEYIRRAREIAHQIDTEAEIIAEELKNI